MESPPVYAGFSREPKASGYGPITRRVQRRCNLLKKNALDRTNVENP
jgi:hypothetical protein